MRAVLQRVSEACVVVEGEAVGKIGHGLMVLLGVEEGDTEKDALYLAEKTAALRVFEDGEGKMNLSVLDIKGEALVVSQFTLLADCRKGRRPGFSRAAAPEMADALYRRYVEELRRLGLPASTGTFQAEMKVSLVNEGPVTILLDSRKIF